MKRGDAIPPELEADARLVVGVLSPDLDVLLRSYDEDVLAERLVRLHVAGGTRSDAEELDTAVNHMVVGRRISLWELGARLAIILATLAIVVAAGLVAASFAGQAFPRFVPVSWLLWPPAPRVFTWILLLLVGAVLLGYVAVWLRSTDRLRLARLACRVAAVHELDSWPGLLLDAPFLAVGARWSYPGWTLGIAALLLAAASVFAGAGSVLGWIVVVVWIVVGVALVRRSWRYRRAQDLAERTLFLGRTD